MDDLHIVADDSIQLNDPTGSVNLQQDHQVHRAATDCEQSCKPRCCQSGILAERHKFTLETSVGEASK
jgi:hypothetical protein